MGENRIDMVNSRLSRYGGCHEEVEVYRVTDRCARGLLSVGQAPGDIT
jgi:hypothetical protein